MPLLTGKDGADIAYSDQGSGMPILLLHGWMMSQKVWHFQLPLAADFRIITMDLRGHGRSNAADFSYESCIGEIIALLDHLEIPQITLLGWSMGAQIALKAALSLRKRISALILVSGTARFCATAGYPYGLAGAEAKGMSIRIRRDYLKTSGDFFKSMFTEDEKSRVNMKDIAAKVVSTLPPLQISLTALAELAESDFRPSLHEINQPLLLIHGTEDRICPYGAASFMTQDIAGSALISLQAVGHAPFLTEPARFNSCIADFVRTVHAGN